MTYWERVMAQPFERLAPIFLVIAIFNAVVIIELLSGSGIISRTVRGDNTYWKRVGIALVVLLPIQLSGAFVAHKHAESAARVYLETHNPLKALKEAASHTASQFDSSGNVNRSGN